MVSHNGAKAKKKAEAEVLILIVMDNGLSQLWAIFEMRDSSAS